MRVLDLFCGAGGAARGYMDAGYEVVGYDSNRARIRRYPGEGHVSDVLDLLGDLDYLRSFDLIHASPPCQTHTRAQHLRDAQGKTTSKVDLIPQTRNALAYAGVPYVIENVPGAPLRADLTLCGSMFDHLYTFDATGRRWLQRHRVFEIHGFTVPQPVCDHRGAGVRPLGVYGSKGDSIPKGGQTAATLADGGNVMGINWMPLVSAGRSHSPGLHRAHRARRQRRPSPGGCAVVTDRRCPTCAEAEWLLLAGEELEQVAARLGIQLASLERHLQRHDRADLIRRRVP